MSSRVLLRLLVALALAAVPGCAVNVGGVPGRDSGPDLTGRDGGTLGDRDSGPIGSGCDASQDADGDGIADGIEGSGDPDGDDVPNYLDPDSDGDGISDADENAGGTPCGPVNHDTDTTPDFLDTDSDNDGLLDNEEIAAGTDPLDPDSDDDGVTDLGEVRGTGTNPNDAASTIPEGDFFVVLPYEGDHAVRTLRFGTLLQRADVYFLIDTTYSMSTPIANVRSSLSAIAAEVATRIPDVAMGVGRFDDFPLLDVSCAGPVCFVNEQYGEPGVDVPYRHLVNITTDLAPVQSALDGLTVNSGGDVPESQTEALYQTATAAGGSWTDDADNSVSLSGLGCGAAGIGAACFRDRALPIIVLVTDADWHEGPARTYRYDSSIDPDPHTFTDAVNALRGIGARFIGVTVTGVNPPGSGVPQANAMATMTGSVNGSGQPLVFPAAGGAVSNAIVDGIATLTSTTPQDVSTRTENVAGNPDDFDATQFILRITPLEGYGPAAGTGYTSKDATTFHQVTPGTEVEFEVEFGNDVRMPPATAEIHRAEIIVVGNGVTDLDRRNVYIIVPPADSDIVIF